MNFEDQLENRLAELERKIQECEVRNEGLDREIQTLLSEYNVSPEQLSFYVSKKENFSEKNWNALLAEKKQLDEKLNRTLDNLVSPKKRKKAQVERNVQPHWLFVR